MNMPLPSSYRYEVVHTDGSPFSIHKNKTEADYWADRIGGRVIDYVPRHDHEREIRYADYQ